MDKTISKKTRNSGVELLRIFAILSIIICHVYGADKTIPGYNEYIMVAVNSFFNAGTGVVIFMLISGYYSIHLSFKRFNKIYSVIYTCVLTTAVLNIVFKKFVLFSFLKSLVPVSTNWQWYISCYVFTMLLSPFLNWICENIDKKVYSTFLSVAVLLFYVIPTFIYFQITGDNGKGIVYMIIAYFIGRYINIYKVDFKKKTLIIAVIILYIFNVAGNIAATYVRGEASWPFSRDLTVVTLLIATCLLMIALKSNFQSKFINSISSKTIYVYLLGLNVYIKIIVDITKYYDSALLLPICIGITLLTYIISVIAAYPLGYVAKLIEKILELIEKILVKIYDFAKPKVLSCLDKHREGLDG